MTLPADEFIRRFLIHLIPQGFQRIRYYGFLGNRHRRKQLALCRQLLQMPELPDETPVPDTLPTRIARLTGIDITRCPVCHQGTMVEVPLPEIEGLDSS